MEIYTLYGPAIRRKCERILRSPADAEDVTQALFVDLLQKGRVDVSLPYLYRAATNRCLNVLRDRKRRQALLDREGPDPAPPARTLCEGSVIGLDLLARLVARLDRKAAEVLVFHFLDDLTQEEIATLLGTSRKTVGKRVAKIRAEVQRLAGEGAS